MIRDNEGLRALDPKIHPLLLQLILSLLINMSEVTKKRRSPADKESMKRLRGDITDAKEAFESISKQLLQVVEYLTITEIRIQQLENIMDKQAESIKLLQNSQSPEFPCYSVFDRREFSSPESLTLSDSEQDLKIDLLDFGDEDHQLVHMSPLTLEEHPGTILNLLCNEVMD
jgi:hypothetical protein